MPNDMVHKALLRALGLGAEMALREAQQKIDQRCQGLSVPDSDLQPALLREVLAEEACES